MGARIRFRLFVICFLLMAVVVFASDAGTPGVTGRRVMLQAAFCAGGALLTTWMFSSALSWRIQRLKEFADNVLNARDVGEPLPDEAGETAALNQSLRRMALHIRELVTRLSDESSRRDAILKSMAEGVLAVDDQMRDAMHERIGLARTGECARVFLNAMFDRSSLLRVELSR